MATKYIVDNLSGQTINGDLTINGNLTTTNLNNSGTYRALLTQTGSLNGDSNYFNNRLIIGETYEITDYQDYDDFSNVANVQSGAALLDFDYVWSPVVGIYGSFNGLTGTTSGSGSGASFDGYWCGTTTPIIINITIDTGGDGYVVGDTITILGTELSGSTPTNDLTITVTEVDTNVNVTGCIFVATGDTPIVWGNSVLTSVGDLVVDVLENTLGDELVWLYDPLFQEGLYLVSFSEYINNNNVCYTFPRNKTQITTPTFIAPFNYDFYSPPQFNLIVSSQIGYFLGPIDDTIFLSVYDFGISSFTGDSLYYTPIEIKLNSSITQEDTPLISINWSTYSGETDFDTYDIGFPPILNVTRLTIGKCGDATAHVHQDYEYSDLTIDLYDDSIDNWVTVWSYTLNNPNYDGDDSPDLYFPGNIDVTFTNITSVSGIRMYSDPGQGQTYHDFDGLTFNFFN
jgi:hypothetical protein